MVTIEEFLEVLTLERTGPDTYRGTNVPVAHGVVFGGQLLAQSILAALQGHEGMRVKTIHTTFARAGRTDAPVEILVDPMQSGRTFASSAVTITQGDRLCTRSIVLLDVDEPDLMRHADTPRTASSPEDGEPVEDSTGDWEIRVMGGVDISDPDAVGPADLDVWTRFVGAPDDPAVGQALLSFATDGFLIGTAMRPHLGVGQAQAHVSLSTGVVSHTLTFHEPVNAGEWLLMSHHSPYAGHGRAYGRADVFRADGQLVASFVQDAMVRAMPERAGGAL